MVSKLQSQSLFGLGFVEVGRWRVAAA
jgi:hypothetical protein